MIVTLDNVITLHVSSLQAVGLPFLKIYTEYSKSANNNITGKHYNLFNAFPILETEKE